MQMRIIWGKIMPGQWDAFEAAFKKALEIRGEVKGLKGQWVIGAKPWAPPPVRRAGSGL
jgi:hypothetical protein